MSDLATKNVNGVNPENVINMESIRLITAAFGGAILGALFTLMILAVINHGTLFFNEREQVHILDQRLSGVDKNVESVIINLETAIENIDARLDKLEAEQP